MYVFIVHVEPWWHKSWSLYLNCCHSMLLRVLLLLKLKVYYFYIMLLMYLCYAQFKVYYFYTMLSLLQFILRLKYFITVYQCCSFYSQVKVCYIRLASLQYYAQVKVFYIISGSQDFHICSQVRYRGLLFTKFIYCHNMMDQLWLLFCIILTCFHTVIGAVL